MKFTLTSIATLATTSFLQAHPGAPGHTHPENTGQSEWPFADVPDFSWSIAIAGLAVIGFVVYKMRKA